MTAHNSPSGFSFILIEPNRVPEFKRRPVAYKLIEVDNAFDSADDLPLDPDAVMSTAPPKDDDLTPTHLRLLDELNDLVAVALLDSWSLAEPISAEALVRLPKQDYEAIRTAVAPFVAEMMPDFSPTPDDGTPTTP